MKEKTRKKLVRSEMLAKQAERMPKGKERDAKLEEAEKLAREALYEMNSNGNS